MWKVDSEEELRALMRTLEDSTKPIIFQEFLAATKGRDLRCVVVGNKLVASMMRIAKSGFKANVHQGGSVKVIDVKPQLEVCLRLDIIASQLTSCDFAATGAAHDGAVPAGLRGCRSADGQARLQDLRGQQLAGLRGASG